MAEGKKKDNFVRNLIVVSVVVIVAFTGVYKVSSNKKVSANASIPKVASAADGYGLVYNPSAKVTVDIFEDFQCPICQTFEGINNKYINELVTSGKAKVVFHPMTFIGPESILAANMAACAADSGKFLEAHANIYANQPAKENSGTMTNNYLFLLGTSVGITDSSFSKCVNDGKYADWTKLVEADAAKRGVNATPTVFVNGKELDRNTQYMDPAKFKKAMTDAGVK
jgi:protein-disulfide isomerase